MTSLKFALLPIASCMLVACGGSSDSNAPTNQPSYIAPEYAQPPSTADSIDLSAKAGVQVAMVTTISGEVSSENPIVDDYVSNTIADISHPYGRETIQGNLSLHVNAEDPDGIKGVTLVLAGLNKSYELCDGNCEQSFSTSVIGINPYLAGFNEGEIHFELWVTDNLDNQILKAKDVINWRPLTIDGVTVGRDGDFIDVEWRADASVSRYNVYFSSEAGVSPENVLNLENGQQYLSLVDNTLQLADFSPLKSIYILVTGVGASGESAFAQTLHVPPPSGLIDFTPTAVNDEILIEEDQPAVSNVLDNDINLYVGDLKVNVDSVREPLNGSLIIADDGEFTYTPNANFFGSDSFSYEIENEIGLTSTGVVDITVIAVNDAPIAHSDTYAIPDDGLLIVDTNGLLQNDSDTDQDTLQVSTIAAQGPEFGQLTLNANGSFTYQSFDKLSPDSFIYTLNDGQGGTSTATVYITHDVNLAPNAVNDSYTIFEDNPLIIDSVETGLLSNDLDPEGDAISIDQSFTLSPTNGLITLNINGTFTYIPDDNFNGIEQFAYQVIDSQGNTSTASLTVYVQEVVDAPVANPDFYIFNQNQPLTVTTATGILLNDQSIEESDLTVNLTLINNVSFGELSLNADGSFVYTPNSLFVGVDSFIYQVENQQGLTSQAQVTLTVGQVNSAPTVVNDSAVVNEDSAATIDVLSNDSDLDGDAITLSIISVDHGLADVENNKINYTPENNFAGIVTIVYQAFDGLSYSQEGVLTLQVTNENDMPEAVSDNISLEEDTLISIDPLINDIDFDADTLSITSATVDNGVVSIVANQLQYSAPLNYSGIATILYTIDDGHSATDTGTITLTIAAVNDAPVVSNDVLNTVEDVEHSIIDVLANDTDVDDINLVITDATVVDGTVTIIDNKLLYNSPLNFFGTTQINYTIVDPLGLSDSGYVAVSVNQVNDAPIANDDAVSILEDSHSITIDVLANDSDIDGDSLSVTGASVDVGTVTVVGNQLTYTPNTDHHGSSLINYSISDGQGGMDSAEVVVTIISDNDAPIAIPDSVTLLEDSATSIIDVLVNDSDADGDSLTISDASVDVGTVLIVGSQLHYTPVADDNGTATISYTINDGQGASATTNVALTITAVNDVPVAVNDSLSVIEDAASSTIDVLANDSDVDGDSLTISNATVDVGSVAIVGNQLTYIPDADYHGVATIDYSINDSHSGIANAQVVVTITSDNDAPIAVDDAVFFNENVGEQTISPLANDTDVDGDVLSITGYNASIGLISQIGDNFLYLAPADYYGPVSINYTISDGNGETASATVNISINGDPDADHDNHVMDEDGGPTKFEVLSNDTDPESETLTVTIKTINIGAATIVGDQIEYTPIVDYFGTAEVVYRVTDPFGATDISTLYITINPINDAPDVINQNFSVNEDVADGAQIGTLTATDAENDTLTYSLVGGDVSLFSLDPSSGALTVNGTDVFDYEQATSHSITVDVTDDGTPNETTQITVSVSVNNVVEPAIPVEDGLFGRSATGYLDIGSRFGGGQFNASTSLGDYVYFVGYTQNVDKDLLIVSYKKDGNENDAFSTNGMMILDFNGNEVATAITSDDDKDLYIAFTQKLGDHQQACVLKISDTGVIDTSAGQDATGVRCTDESKDLIINDIAFSGDKVYGVGKATDSQSDSLWIKYDATNMSFEASSPVINDISGGLYNDEIHAIKRLDSSQEKFFIAGYIEDNIGVKQAYVHYTDENHNSVAEFNGGDVLFPSDPLGLDEGSELLSISGKEKANPIAFFAGYTTRANGEKEAVVYAIDDTGTLEPTFASSGVGLFDLDASEGTGNGGAYFNHLEYTEHEAHRLILSGNSASEFGLDDEAFVAVIKSDTGILDVGYGTGGLDYFITPSGISTSVTSVLDKGEHTWFAGYNLDGDENPLIVAYEHGGVINDKFPGGSSGADGYLIMDTTSNASTDTSSAVIQLKNGTYANSYIDLSVMSTMSSKSLILNRYTEGGQLDTTFGEQGFKKVLSGLVNVNVAAVEQSDGKILIAGTFTDLETHGFVVRVDQDGHLDQTFADKGIFSTRVISSSTTELNDIGLSSIVGVDKIVVVGTINDGNLRSLVARINPDGSLDSNLDGFDGGAEHFYAQGYFTGLSGDEYQRVWVNSNGEVFAGGSRMDTFEQTLLTKYLATGDIDTSFAVSGSYVEALDPLANDHVANILEDSSSNLYVISNLFGTQNQIGIVKLDSSGSKDSSFASSGVGIYALSDSAEDSLVFDATFDNSNNIIVVGTTYVSAVPKGVIGKITPLGTLDNLFGFAGVGFFAVAECSGFEWLNGVELINDSQIVVASTCDTGVSQDISISKFEFFEEGVTP